MSHPGCKKANSIAKVFNACSTKVRSVNGFTSAACAPIAERQTTFCDLAMASAARTAATISL